jgi:hypothetical protein
LKERELSEQLKELEEQNAAAGTVPDKKGKAPAPKGKAGAASNEDQLRADLDMAQKSELSEGNGVRFPSIHFNC